MDVFKANQCRFMAPFFVVNKTQAIHQTRANYRQGMAIEKCRSSWGDKRPKTAFHINYKFLKLHKKLNVLELTF